MSIINVQKARGVDELKRQTFINFHDVEKKLSLIGEKVIDYQSGNVTSPSSPGGNIFERIYLGDALTWITRDTDGNLVFHDHKAGDITLTQVKTLLAILWTFGDALGIKMKNLAGTELMVGITEDADGVTIFNDTSEVE